MKRAFTLLEMVFVIVVIGIISKVGVDILLNMYNNYMDSKSQNFLQAQSQATITQISNRLQFRIKDSVIARNADTTFRGISDATGSETILEWIGYDIDGFNGKWNGTWNKPSWSGFIDVDSPSTDASHVKSPESNASVIDEYIQVLSNGDSTIAESAIFFIGSNVNIENGFGWDGSFNDENASIIPITSGSEDILDGNFSSKDIYEFYQLAWSAYAIEFKDGNLKLYYDYQPWKNESFTDGKSALLAQNVSSFRFQAVGDMIKVQLCIKDTFYSGSTSEAAFCKEKAVF